MISNPGEDGIPPVAITPRVESETEPPLFDSSSKSPKFVASPVDAKCNKIYGALSCWHRQTIFPLVVEENAVRS